MFLLGEDNCSMLKKWFPRLVKALQPHIGSVADECWSKDLISVETYDAVMDLNLTNANKARRLLKNVWQTISCDPQAFEKFCGIVDKLDGCGGIMDATSEPCKTIKRLYVGICVCVGLCLSKKNSIIDLPSFYMQCDFVGISCYVSIFSFREGVVR